MPLQSTSIPLIRALFFVPVIFAATLSAQRLTVVIDPARGGTENGARIDGSTYEKQVTLDLANRLRSLLTARNFDVVLTREGDTIVSNDQRAAVANQSRAVACLLLHSTGSGTGLHLFTSSLAAAAPSSTGVLWDEAQAPFAQRSQRLATEFATAFSRSSLPVSIGKTWIRPLDNMQCPALAIEVAPESGRTDAADRDYQTRIADAIANSLLIWRNQADIVQSIVGPPHETPSTTQQDTTKTAAAASGSTTEKAAPSEAKPKPAAAPAAALNPANKPIVHKAPAPAPVKPVPAPVKPEVEGSAPQ